MLNPIPKNSLFFAPMEGITDEAFRKTIIKLYPEWDYLATDFLRVPSAGHYPKKYIIKHFGTDLSRDENIRNKTMFQILTSHRAFTIDMVKEIVELGYPWLDINLGCPSNTVTKNGGGSSLLLDLDSLRILMKNIRSHFSGRLTAKVRTGFHHTDDFETIIKTLNDEGVELITVHGRTRDMMYKYPAIWSFIEKAVHISKVPIVGNGDIWCTQDIDRMMNETGCHGVMVARGALKSPWMAQDYKKSHFTDSSLERSQRIKTFFKEYRHQLELENISDRGLLKQTKSVSRFMFEGIESGETLRRQLLLAQTVPEIFAVIESL